MTDGDVIPFKGARCLLCGKLFVGERYAERYAEHLEAHKNRHPSRGRMRRV